MELRKDRNGGLNLVVMYRMFVIGGVGFIGVNFVCFVVKEWLEVEIMVFDKFIYAGNCVNFEGVEVWLVVGDIVDVVLVDELVV